MLLGMEQAAITWVSHLWPCGYFSSCIDVVAVAEQCVRMQLLFVPTAMAMYACLVSHNLLDSSVFRVPPGARTSPEGEVMLASLFTLAAWRGIYFSQML